MQELIGQTLARYEIVEKIGEGGMGAVFKARQPELDRWAAVKVLPPHYAAVSGFKERFLREAQVIAQLEHPHILPVYDFGQQEAYIYLVMRYIDQSRTLADVMSQPITLQEMLGYLEQIAAALDYAHQRGIVHRDVKPSNILLDDQDWLFLADFGLAKLVQSESQLTTTGTGMGTPAYMSPEQGSGGQVDARADVYAVGVMVYQMLTGQIPHEADTPHAIIYKRNTEPAPPLRDSNPDIPPAVEKSVQTALAPLASERFQNTGAFVTHLRQAIEQPGHQKTLLKATLKTPGWSPQAPRPASSARFCHNCGAKIEAQAQFCTACGTALPGQPATSFSARRQRGGFPWLWLMMGAGILLLLIAVVVSLFVFTNRGNTTDIPRSAVAEETDGFDESLLDEPSHSLEITATTTVENDIILAGQMARQSDSLALASTQTITPTPLITETPVSPTLTVRPTSTLAIPTETPPPPSSTPTVPADIGMIVLQGASRRAGLSAQIQWLNEGGGWSNVDNWQGALDNTGRISWEVWSKDFNTGPFRWVVYDRDGATEFTSQSFYLPSAGQEQLINMDVEPPVPPTPTATPTPLGQNCSFTPDGALAGVWQTYRHRLGCPVTAQSTIPTLAEETFQGGHMFWRSDTDEVYVIYDRQKNGGELAEGRWQTDPAWKWDGSNPDGVGLTPPPGLVEPKRGFGWLWRTHLGGADGGLGWALDQEYGFDNVGQAQKFEQGLIFKGSSSKIYVLFYNGEFIAR